MGLLLLSSFTSDTFRLLFVSLPSLTLIYILNSSSLRDFDIRYS